MMAFLDLFDLLIIMIVFSLISRSLISLLRRIYYFLFAQINLFSYKLGKFNQSMLNPVENQAQSKSTKSTNYFGITGSRIDIQQKNSGLRRNNEQHQRIIESFEKSKPQKLENDSGQNKQSSKIEDTARAQNDNQGFFLNEMIFLQDNEIKRFFGIFFQMFERQAQTNKLDISRIPNKLSETRSEKRSSNFTRSYQTPNQKLANDRMDSEVGLSDGIFKSQEYKQKFKENMIKPIERGLIERRRARNQSTVSF